jgi:positive regulator of sigma E activity
VGRGKDSVSVGVNEKRNIESCDLLFLTSLITLIEGRIVSFLLVVGGVMELLEFLNYLSVVYVGSINSK